MQASHYSKQSSAVRGQTTPLLVLEASERNGLMSLALS
jgi:hypothetical protein